jgi:hypothetical protein
MGSALAEKGLVGQGERGPSPERLRAIALNRLKSLGIAAWVAHGWGRGRLNINPDRFKSFAGVRLSAEQDFVIYQHAFLAFPTPSPLQHLGGIRFYEEESAASLMLSIERRWAALISGTEAALSRARAFCPDAKLDPESWMIEWTMEDRIGRVVFRFDGRLAILYAYAVNGKVIQYGKDSPPIALQLPPEPIQLDEFVLAPHIRAARARMGVETEREDTGRISLDLASTDLLSLREDGAVVASSNLPASGDLDIDLEKLKTGDLKVYANEDTRPAVVKTNDAHQGRRYAREPQNVPAKMRWNGGELDVVLADVSAGGVFARCPTPAVPKRGETVQIYGFGKLSITGVVAFVRPQEEAHLFATGAGVGVSFMIEPTLDGLRSHQQAPSIAVFLKEWDARRRTLSAVDEARGICWTADTLAELAVILVHLEIKLVVIDESIRDRIEAALGLVERKIPVLALSPGEPIDASKIRRRLTP